MKKEKYYTYLGTNGTITSPVHLEDIYYTVKYSLEAENNKVLTKDNKNFVQASYDGMLLLNEIILRLCS